MKHTPGPWRDCLIAPSTVIIVAKESDTFIARVMQPMPLKKGVWEANARLIAAAPELLALLKSILDCCADTGGDVWFGSEGVKQLKQLVAKAEGTE